MKIPFHMYRYYKKAYYFINYIESIKSLLLFILLKIIYINKKVFTFLHMKSKYLFILSIHMQCLVYNLPFSTYLML